MAADSIRGVTVIRSSGSSDSVWGFHWLKFSPIATREFPKSSIRYSKVSSAQSVAVNRRLPTSRYLGPDSFTVPMALASSSGSSVSDA